MNLCGLLFFALPFFTTRIEGNAEPPICPPGLPEERVVYTPEEISKIRREVGMRTWSTPITLSSDGELIRDQFRTMLTDGNEDWATFAYMATMSMAVNLFNTVASPNLCPIAQVINATPTWVKTDDCTEFTAGLRKYLSQTPLRILGAYESALADTGCGKMITDKKGNLKIIPITSNQPGQSPLTTFADTETCEGNGRVYDIEPMLDLMGDRYSNIPGATEDIKCILRRMYQSDDDQDRVIAAMTLVMTSPPMMGTILTYNYDLPIAFYSLAYLTCLPNECCPKYRKDLMQVFTEINCENDRLLDYSIRTYCKN